MTNIYIDELTLQFNKKVALNKVTLDIEGDVIVGILGRRGSGKTSLLSILAALKYPSSGTVAVNGENPFENSKATTSICYTWDGQKILKKGSVKKALDFCSKLRPNWDMTYANALLERFEIDPKMAINKLSDEENALLNIINGLASKAPITIYDGTFLGIGYEQKQVFFNELKYNQENDPRMIILSTSNADEIESLVQDLIIFDRGNDIAHATVEEIKASAKDIMQSPTQPTLQQILLHFTKEDGGGDEV